MLVNIEIKNFPGDPDHDPTERVAAAVVDLLHDRGGRDRVLVSSFSLATIDRVRALDPSVPTGFLTMPAFDPVEGAVLAAGHGHAAVHPFVLALAGERAAAVAEQAHAVGVAVNVWTVNDPARCVASPPPASTPSSPTSRTSPARRSPRRSERSERSSPASERRGPGSRPAASERSYGMTMVRKSGCQEMSSRSTSPR